MVNKKRRSNGFGSSLADIYVVVNKPHDTLLMESDWEKVEEDELTAVFANTCSNRYEGDDETVVSNLWIELPESFDKTQFKIDWDRSTY